MQKHRGLLLLTVLVGLAACKGHEKKILIYASSDITVDDAKQHVTVSEGTTHHEQELDFSSGSPVTLDVQSPQGKLSVTAADDGLYILNLEVDTVVGSFRHVGADNGTPHITQDQLKKSIDSLQKLIQGLNVSETNRNYFIPPGKMVRITAETKAKIFGPFTSIPGSFDAGSVPEIYKFYTVPEEREIIDKLQKDMK
ncbi:MAG TPA: hypothetical protein VG101_06040 [Puia sp.]|jgi:hypothetical protein|nr:hypothetical protein [Puia sp.]